MTKNNYYKFRTIVDSHMGKIPEVVDSCNRCLNTERWDGKVILMIVDCSFTSIGLSYFHSVVPKVDLFRKQFLKTGKMKSLNDLLQADETELRNLWKNRRSWSMAKGIASHLCKIKHTLNLDDKETLRHWAKESTLVNWERDASGSISGVGINSYQYLRMMGGIDTVMPDKIVKRVINGILEEAGMEIPSTDIEFVNTVEKIGPELGYKPIELCWMTWLIQSEANVIHMKEHSEILAKI